MASSIAQIRKSVLTLALPVTVSTLLQRTEGIAAVFLVGGLGATSIAAVGLGQLLAFIATTLVSGLSVGANVLIAQLWGARRTKDVGEAATHLLGLAAVVSCALVALGLSLNRLIMELLGAESDVIALALPYSNFIFLVIPCTIFLQVLSSIIQGTGDTKTPMYALIAVNLLYLTIAYPLIYGLWGFPALGITGAAVAAGLAEGTGVAYLFWTCRTLVRKSLHVRRDLLRSTWQIGASVSGERIFQQAGIILYTKMVLLYGTVTYAAHQVGLSIESLSFLPGYGFAIAAATMVGQSIGAGKYVDGCAVLFLSLCPTPRVYQRRSRRRTRDGVPAHRRYPPSAARPHHGPGWIVTWRRRHQVHYAGDDGRHVGSPPTPRSDRRALARTRCALRLECDDRRLDRPNGPAALALSIRAVESDSGHSLIHI